MPPKPLILAAMTRWFEVPSSSAATSPRQRILERGPQALSDAELLAVLLQSGGRAGAALDVAQSFLEEHRGLRGLTRLSDPQPLLTSTRLAVLQATFEITVRLARAKILRGSLLVRPAAVAQYLRLRYASMDQEILGALYLDTRHRLLHEEEFFRGTLTQARVEPRVILKQGLLLSAHGVLLFHTHPNGNPEPSVEDLDFTERLSGACELVGLRLVDHLILGDPGRWTSLRRRGHLK